MLFKKPTQIDAIGRENLPWEGVLPWNKRAQAGESGSSPSCLVYTRKQTLVSCFPDECPNSRLRALFITDSLSSCIRRAPAGNVPRKRDKRRLLLSLAPAGTLTARLRAPPGWVPPALSLPPDKHLKSLTSTLRYHSQKKQSWQFLRGRKYASSSPSSAGEACAVLTNSNAQTYFHLKQLFCLPWIHQNFWWIWHMCVLYFCHGSAIILWVHLRN